MENEKKEESKKEETVEQPTDQTTPVDEEKDSQKVEDTQPEGEEEVTLSKKELEDLRKRADDFNRSVELKRLSKLEKKEADSSDVKEEIGQLRAEIQSFKTESHNSKLSEAYREFVGDNRWADEDNVFDKIKENFNSEGTETKDELLSKFKYAAQTAFPDKYEKHLEDKIKAKVLSEKNVDNSGGGASPVDTIHKDNKPKTQEDAMKDKMETLYKKSQPGR